MKRAVLCVLLLAAACPWAVAADEYPVKVYPCPRLSAPPVIDGSPDDACWAAAPLVSGFTRYNKPVLLDVQASFRVGYDDRCLYFAVLCDEPLAAKLTPTFAGRDSSGCFRGETIEIFLDPRHDHTDYYQFAVNLAGSFYDSHKADAYWNSTARLGTKLGAKGWTLELAIPWRDVGLPAPRPGAVVGFNVCRDRYAGGAREWSNWSQTMANFHDAPRFGHLVLSPTDKMLASLAPELRRGDRRGPIVLFTREGEAGRAYLAMAREALRGLVAQLAELEAEAAREGSPAARDELARRLADARQLVAPFRKRIAQAGAKLDAAEWTRMSVAMTRLGARLGELVWDARLAALLSGI